MRIATPRFALALCLFAATSVRAQPGACAPELLAADRRGSPSSISRQGDVLYLGAGAAMVVIDTSELLAPVERGRADLDELVLDVAHWQSTVVALGTRGLYFVDATDGEHPELTGTFAFPAGWVVRAVAARESHAFVPEAGGLRILSFADPSAPVEVGFFPAASTRDVAVSGNRAYLLSAGVLRVVNVSNPANPYLVASVPVGTGNDDRLSIAGSGNRLAAWGSWSSGHHYGSGAELFSLADPALPVKRSSLGFDDWSFASLAFAFDRVYVGELIYDVSSLANPTPLGSLGSLLWPVAAAIAPDPDYLFAAEAGSGLHVVDATIPANPQVAASVLMPSEAQDGYLAGTLAVLVRRSELETLDLSDPAHPTSIGRLPWPSTSFQEVERVRDHAYVTTSYPEDDIRIVDLSNPSQPEVVGTLGNYVWNVPAWASDIVGFVDECSDWLRLIDVADPSSPLPLGQISLGGACYKTDFAMTADRLYLWDYDGFDGDSRLRVFDLSDPALPVEIGSAVVEPWHWARSVVHGRHLLLTDVDRFEVLDVASAASPVRVASLPLPFGNWYQRKLSLYGTRALVAPRDDYDYHDDSTFLIDVADPLEPVVVAELRPPGYGRAAFAGPGLIVVADGPAGYSIYSSCVPFADGFESGDVSEWVLAGR